MYENDTTRSKYIFCYVNPLLNVLYLNEDFS